MDAERRRCLAAALLAAVTPFASAQAPQAAMPPAVMEGPMRDPYVPPALRKQARPAAAPTEGAALRAQVEAGLRERFAAAAGPGGTLTREQARRAGLGFIAHHFDAIDREGRGRVAFDDYKRFLKARGAALD